MRSRLRGESGFTLLEILVVLMIISLSVTLVVPSIMRGLGRAGLKTTTKKMAASLNYSRNQALRQRSVFYVEARGNSLIIRKAGSKGSDLEIEAATDTEVASIEGHVIAFYPGGGSSGGMLKVMDSKSKYFYTIKVEPSTGRVRVSALM